jgi:hypothetical protein
VSARSHLPDLGTMVKWVGPVLRLGVWPCTKRTEQEGQSVCSYLTERKHQTHTNPMQLAATGENFSPEHLLQTHRNENAQHFNQITIKQESKRLKAQYLLSLVVGAQANWKRMWSLREWPGWCVMKLWSNQIESKRIKLVESTCTAMTKRSKQEQKTLRRKTRLKDLKDEGRRLLGYLRSGVDFENSNLIACIVGWKTSGHTNHHTQSGLRTKPRDTVSFEFTQPKPSHFNLVPWKGCIGMNNFGRARCRPQSLNVKAVHKNRNEKQFPKASPRCVRAREKGQGKRATKKGSRTTGPTQRWNILYAARGVTPVGLEAKPRQNFELLQNWRTKLSRPCKNDVLTSWPRLKTLPTRQRDEAKGRDQANHSSKAVQKGESGLGRWIGLWNVSSLGVFLLLSRVENAQCKI